MFNLVTYLAGFGLFFLAACTKGILGFGVNIVSVPLMSLMIGPKAAIAIVSLPSLFNNLVVVFSQRREPDAVSLVKRIMPLLIAAGIGITIGSFLLYLLDTALISLILGLITILYVLTNRVRANWQVPPEQEQIVAPLAGLGAGLLAGVSGISAPILVAYLYSLRLDKRQFVYVISVIFVVLTASQSLNFWLLGFYTSETVLIGLSYFIPIFLGTIFGNRLQTKISQDLFNKLVLAALFVVGLDLIRRGLHFG